MLRTDASDVALETVLMQAHNGNLFPVCYVSRKIPDLSHIARFPDSSSAQQLYVVSISVRSGLWDVGSYQTLMYCILASIFAVYVGI